MLTKEQLSVFPKSSVYVRESRMDGSIGTWKRKYNGVATNQCDTHVLFVGEDDKILDGEWLPKSSKRMRVEVAQ
jgi:hypothetical protein